MRFFTLSKTHVAGRRILQDFPHIALGKSCKRGTSNYPDFPAIRAAKITNISKNADLPDTRIFPHGLTEGRQTAARCRRGAALPGFSHIFYALRRAEPWASRPCAPSRPRRWGKIACHSHPQNGPRKKWNPSGIASCCIPARG